MEVHGFQRLCELVDMVNENNIKYLSRTSLVSLRMSLLDHLCNCSVVCRVGNIKEVKECARRIIVKDEGHPVLVRVCQEWVLDGVAF